MFLSGTAVITIYAPMIYTARCIMFWMRAYPLQGQVGGGWALEFESFLGPKNSRIPGPNPLPLAQVKDLHATKTLCAGLYKS
jgi:hypothetical protein